MKRPGAWIDVWDIEEAEHMSVAGGMKITQTGERFQCGKDLAELTEKNWAPKAATGWTSSWVPFVQNVSYKNKWAEAEGAGSFRVSVVDVKLGTMAYKEIEAINMAIEQGLSWAPEKGFNPCLSVGFPVVTDDGKVVFQRRPANVHCPNILIHEPCGYMTSLAFAPRAECGNPEFAQDKRLFDLKTQLDYRRSMIADTFELSEKAVEYKPAQAFLATGCKSVEMYLSTTGKVHSTEREMRGNISEKIKKARAEGNEKLAKRLEAQEFFFVPAEDLKPMLGNQGRLSKVDATQYRPSDPREMPLIDESLVGILYGYRDLTGQRLDVDEMIERLNHDGMKIRRYGTFLEMTPSKKRNFNFPTRI